MLFTPRDRSKLKDAFDEYNKHICASFPDDSELMPISPELEARLQKHIDKHSQGIQRTLNSTLRRASVIVAAVILGTTVTCLGVIAGSETVRDFVISVFEDSSQVVLDTPNKLNEIETVYGLLEAPPGYTLANTEKHKKAAFEYYHNAEGEILYFNQYVADDNTTFGINTQDGYSEKLMLDNDTEALYYNTGNAGGIMFIRDGYLFEIIGAFDKDTLIGLTGQIVAK